MAGVLIAAAGYLTWIGSLAIALERQLGPDATPQQQQAALHKMLASGERPPVPNGAMVLFAGGTLAGVLALICGIRSLLRQEPRRGLAVAGLILGTSVAFCQVLPMLVALAARSAAPGP